MAPGTYNLEESEGQYYWMPYRDERHFDFRFNRWDSNTTLTVSNDRFSLGGQVTGEASVDTRNGDASKPPVGSDQ